MATSSQGDLFIDDPKIAMLYAPNLTLVAAKATDEQLDQAIRQGIGHDGRPSWSCRPRDISS